MGVLPLQFETGQDRDVARAHGKETYDIDGIAGGLTPGARLTVRGDAPTMAP